MLKRQKIYLIILILTYVYFFIFENQLGQIITLGLSMPLLIMAFAPLLYQKINIPIKYRYIPILISMVLPTVLFSIHIDWFTDEYHYFLITMLLCLILLLTRYNNLKEAIKVSTLMEPISKLTCFMQMVKLTLIIIGEELLFRAFYYNFLSNPTFWHIILNGLVFACYHHFNRFAHNQYKFIDYVYHFLLSVILGYCYLSFDKIFAPIVFGHITYNFTNYIILYQRGRK